jgi:integrase/recombinase XerD
MTSLARCRRPDRPLHHVITAKRDSVTRFATGFIPRVLRREDVSLLRADETVFNAMLHGWRAQMLARGLDVTTIKARGRLISRFVDFTNEYLWRWRPIDVD